MRANTETSRSSAELELLRPSMSIEEHGGEVGQIVLACEDDHSNILDPEI